MFGGKITQEEFYKTYGGQRYHGILTPRDYPFIYLLYTEGKYPVDNIDVEGDGTNSIVHFALEGSGENIRGNKAVEEHRTRKDVYNSILLFRTMPEKEIEYVGEYEYIGTETENDVKYFVLHKVDISLEDVVVYHVDNEEKMISSLPKWNEYFVRPALYTSPSFDAQISTDLKVNEGDFLDKDYKVINKMESNSSPEVKKISQFEFILERYSKQINKLAKKKKAKNGLVNVNDAMFYIVNVGWGLYTLLVIKFEQRTEVWGLDCGMQSYDGYYSNIAACICHIKQDYFEHRNFVLSKLFLSHPHEDHFNAFDENLVDENTEVWINPFIYNAKPTYANLLKQIIDKKCIIVNPLTKNSNGLVKVLFPKKSIKHGGAIVKRNSYYKTTNANQVSPLIEIIINDKKLIITGDIVSDSWKWYINEKNRECRNERVVFEKEKIDVYVHSHHGRPNGYEVEAKLYGISNETKNILDIFDLRYTQVVSLNSKFHGWVHHHCVGNPCVGPFIKTDGDWRFCQYDILTGKYYYFNK